MLVDDVVRAGCASACIVDPDPLHPVVFDHADGAIVGLTALVGPLVHIILELLEAFQALDSLHQWPLPVLLLEIQIVDRANHW